MVPIILVGQLDRPTCRLLSARLSVEIAEPTSCHIDVLKLEVVDARTGKIVGQLPFRHRDCAPCRISTPQV